jgi:hypothetical protein
MDVDGLAPRATISGGVNLIVQHTKPEGWFATRADLVVIVRLQQPTGQAIYDRRVATSARAVAPSLEGASSRARAVAGDALEQFVATLVGDAELEASLVAYVGPAPKR